MHQSAVLGNSTIKLNDKTYDLTPPPRRSTLVRSKHAQIIDAYTSTDIPVYLTRQVETACMLVEPISSLTRCAPGLEVPLAVVSSQSTGCRLTNPTDTSLSIPAGCVIAIARNIFLNTVTEMIDFLQLDSDSDSQVNSLAQAQGDGANDSENFYDTMPCPEPAINENSPGSADEIPAINENHPKLTAIEVAELIAFLLKNKKVFASTLDKLGQKF